MKGVLLLNKPSGMTSFSAVNKCRRILGEKKAGHTGTLDPQASGLMIVLIGSSTKLASYAVCDHKVYHAGFSFGRETDTGDIWGETLREKHPQEHCLEEVQQAALKLTGDIMQVPPMYSAVHQDGKKLYELARKGKVVERRARPAHVDYIRIGKDVSGWTMDASVSSGTYIRTLISDLGALLGEYAIMTSLVRESIEGLSLQEAQTLEEIEKEPHWISPLRILHPSLHTFEILDPSKVKNGMTIDLPTEEEKVILTYKDEILAAYVRRSDCHYHCERGLQ